MSQQILVGIIVVAAATYASWRLMPGALREKLARGAGKAGRHLGLSETGALQLTRTLENKTGCGNCQACATPAEKSEKPLQFHK